MADDDEEYECSRRPRNFSRPSNALQSTEDEEPEFSGGRSRLRSRFLAQPPAQPQAQAPQAPQATPQEELTVPSMAQLSRSLQTMSIIGQSQRGDTVQPTSSRVIPPTGDFGGLPEQSHRQQQQQQQTTSIIGLSHRGGTSLPISTSAAPAPPFSAKAAAADKVIDLVANYVHVNFKSDIIVRQYHVDFTPKVDNVETRARLVADTVGPLFNQVYLYDKQHTVMSPADIPDGGGDGGITFRKELRPGRPPVELKFRRTSELSVDDEQMFHCLNMQLRDNMERMEQVQILRHYYDMQKRQEIAGQALEVIPGIVNSIKNCQAGLLMSLDTIHKVLHKRTVLDIIKNIDRRSLPGPNKPYERELVGSIVMTLYNNRTYRICGVDRDKTPLHAFNRGSNTNPADQTSLVDYYQNTYNITIADLRQPLLIATPSNFERKQKSKRLFMVPELCYITGLTPNMQSDYNLKRVLVQSTQLSPEARVRRYNDFLTRLNTSAPVRDSLAGWGMAYGGELMRVKGTLLGSEGIRLGEGRGRGGSGSSSSNEVPFAQQSADFTREIKGRTMYRSCTLTKWHVVFNGDRSQNSMNSGGADAVNHFLRVHAAQLAQELGMRYAPPALMPTEDESAMSFLSVIRSIGEDSQLILVVLPTNRKNTYDDVKRHLCCTEGVPSQCVLAKTLFKRNMSISSKIMIQIACKVGAEPWVLNTDALPTGLMIIGIDVCRDKTKRKKSVDGFVASLNRSFSSWFNKISYHQNVDDTSDHLNINLGAALRAYKKRNEGKAPDKILVLRDGISEGQYKNVLETELQQLKVRARQENPTTKLTMICISKRINTRFFDVSRGGDRPANPVSGTVVDNSIVSANIPQFFLVSQLTNQGTVSPTSYDVIYDDMGWPLVEYQRLMYKLCHLYYNWTGLVSVPSPIQYAHKLAYLAAGSFGESNFREDKLSEQLFYL